MTTQTLTVENIFAGSVEALSRMRGEPEWMLELRLRAWRFFEEIPWPTGNEETWRRTKLTGFKLEDFERFVRHYLGVQELVSVVGLPGRPPRTLIEVLQDRGGLLADAGHAGHIVAGVADQGLVVDQL